MSETSNVQWADLDRRAKLLLSVYETTLAILDEADDDKEDEESPTELRHYLLGSVNELLEDDEEDHRPCTKDELAWIVDLYPLVSQDMHREFSDALSACLKEWQTKYPECDTFGELMASHNSAGHA